MPTECELCHEMYEKADDEPEDICPACWEAHLREVDAPTPAELAAEAAYYAHLESLFTATAVPAEYITEDAGDDDDGGYCGPTCGKYGNW